MGLDLLCFIQVLYKHMTPEQVRAVLQEFQEADDDGKCPVCYEPEVAVNVNGLPVEPGDPDFYAFAKKHRRECPINILDAALYVAENV